MTVAQLIALLQKEDPNAEVGVSLSWNSGWVNKLEGIKHTDTGVVCLDQNEATIGEEEMIIE